MKTKTFVIVAIVVLLIAAYAIVGFVVAPKMVRSALLKDIPESISATATVGEIHINPFLLQVTVNDFALTGADGEKLLGFQRLLVDFELSSIWHRAYSFGNIDIAAPFVSAVMAKNRGLNLLQLRPKQTPPKFESHAGSNESLPAIRIGSFKVSDGLVTYEDRRRPDTFAARLEPINFELREFTTGVAGGKFTFTAASKLGERVEWHGHLSVDPIESDGEFQVNGLLAHTLWEYLQDQVNFVINSGTIDLAATYKFSLKESGGDNLQVDVSKIGLTDLTVRPKGSEADWITVPSLMVTGTSVDLAARRAHVDLVSLAGAKLITWLEPDGSVNLMQLAATPSTAGVGAGVTAPMPAAPMPAAPMPAAPMPAAPMPAAPAPTVTTNQAAGTPSPPWAFDLRRLEVKEASISAEDRTSKPAVKLLLAPLSLQVDGASQDLSKPVDVTFDTRINESGSLSLSGAVTPQPAMANLNLKWANIDLTVMQPYIAQQTAMTLMSGKLGGEGKLHYAAQAKTATLQFAGNLAVEKMHTVDDALHDDFIDWDRLDILGLNYSQGPDRLDIDQIVAQKLYARVIIESDASMNVKRVLRIPTTTTATTTKVKATTAKSTVAAGPAAAKGGARSAAMPIAIKKITLQASQANFADLSVIPNFATGIQKLEGSVVGLSSKPGSRATVDLNGSIDAFSPVSITGQVNVLGPLYTDLIMSFRNISLPVFDPYSGKFAGYDIAKGKLTTELHYKIDGRKLDAQHHIVVEQLEFGDKTVSKDAVSLPIKLAVSLLKDRNGVIDLNLPVTGTLDDPSFKLSAVIWEVFVHILEKAVTEPFALLGSLFGGGPDMQLIDFQPGSATMDPAALDKANSVAKALIERPQLKIDVPIAVVPDVDRPALMTAKYGAELSAAQAAAGTPKNPASQLDVLAGLYAKDFGNAPKYPDAVTTIKAKPDLMAAKVDFLSKAIRDHVVVDDDALQTLGQQRAIALQKALLADPQVTAERVFLVANDKAVAKDGTVRLELSLK